MLINGPLDSLFLRPGSHCRRPALGMGCFPQPCPRCLRFFVAEPRFSYSCLKKCHSGAKCSSPSLCLAFSCRLLLFFLFLPSLGISV